MTAAREVYLRLLLVLAVAAAVGTDVPSTGLLLAGAAALLASSTGRHGVAGPAVRAALLRLLVPYALFAALLLVHLGPGAWRSLLPLGQPSTEEPWTAGVPVVSTWFWLLLLSSPLLWLARRWPLRVLAVPVLVLAPISVGLVTGSGAAHDVLVAVCTFGCCWVLGFLYADGRLTRVPLPAALAVGGATLALGLWFGSELLLHTGGVLLLLRAQPAFAWLSRLRLIGAVLRFLTDRLGTAVLWTGPAVGTAALLGVDARFEPLAAGVLLLVAVVVLGWPERLGDLRVGRRHTVGRYRFEDNVAAPATLPRP